MAGRTTVLCNVTVLVDGYNLSGACNEATVSYASEMLDATTFGLCTRVRRGGLTTFNLALKGFDFLGSACSAEALFQPIVGSSGHMFAFFPTTITGCAECGYVGRGTVDSYSPGGTVGTIMPFTTSIVGTGVEA
jgi:hypothetical protein